MDTPNGPPRPTLDELGTRFGTDKASTDHDYLSIYADVFEPLRDQPLTLLEIGVASGASLATWEAYFPQARIIGADIKPAARSLARERVRIEIIDQSDVQDLVDLALRHGPFDIIIEDGSHMWEHQTTTLRTLFPFVKDGGFYVVEDLHTNYGATAESFRGVASRSCMDELKRLADSHVAGDAAALMEEEDAFIRTYARRIRRMVFCRHACLIQKAPRRRRRAPSVQVATAPGLLAVPAGATAPRLKAHVSFVGDVVSEDGAVSCAGSAGSIQGFALYPAGEAGLPAGLLYRARLQSGEWTTWSPPGAFVGTRGRGLDLTGFAVRLDAPGSATHEVRAAGLFGADPTPVAAAPDGSCTPAGAPQPLRAMQVLLPPRR